MKLRVRHTLLTMLTLCTMFAGSSFVPSIVYAAPAPPDTNPVATCDLPDGGTGVLQDDHQTCCPVNTPTTETTGATACLFAKYLNPAIQLISAAVGIAIVIAIVLGAMEYITSGGDPQRAASGKKRIVEALIGLAAFALLYAFLQFIIPGGLANG